MSEIDVRLGVDYKSKNLLRAQKDLRGVGAAAEFAKLKMAGAAYAIYRLGKESVIAAAKAQKLDTTFATSLRNMNIGNQTEELLTYIDTVSLATGVLDQELIPAFSRLLSSTKNVAASQKLLNIAVDTAQGTGKDLSTVTTILTKAMEGQRKGLSSLGLGIDAATLKTMDLAEVVAALEKAYGGTAAANANTFAGMLDRVRRSAELAKESMGQAFLSQLDLSAQEMADLNTAVQAAAKGFGWLMGAVGSFVATSISGLRNVRDYFMQDPIIRWIVEKMGLGGTSIYTGNPNLRGLYKKTPEERANEALMKLLKKMDEDAKKRDAAELARQRAAEAARKRQAALDKELAQKQMRYDTERIGLQAAFARSEDDVTKARIRDLLELNTAQYASALGLNTILDIEKLVQEQLDKILGTQMKWNTEIYKSIAGYGQLQSAAAAFAAAQPGSAAQFRAAEEQASRGFFPSGSDNALPMDSGTGPATWTLPSPGGNTTVNVTVQGSVMAQQDLEAAIAGAVNSAARAGLSYSQVFSRL